jgi:hypothetical protein
MNAKKPGFIPTVKYEIPGMLRDEDDPLFALVRGRSTASQEHKEISPQRQSIIDAVTALWGSVAAIPPLTTAKRNQEIHNWLKANHRDTVNDRTIRRTLRTGQD